MFNRLSRSSARFLLFIAFVALPAIAQDDATTQNGSSAYNGGWITGPASNPLSFLNGPAYRTTGQKTPYDFPDFAPMAALNQQLPPWISFGLEERLRAEGMEHQSFQLHDDDNYLLNRWRFLMRIKPTSWLRIVGQMQDARAWLQQPPLQPPNTNRFDLKLAYAEFGNPEHQWISVRAGRQLINYNNTIIANSEWRNQARSYDAVVANLHYDRYRAGIFAASVVIPLDEGISHHLEGNTIYGVYGSIDSLIAPSSTLEPFVLWRATSHESEQAYGVRWKGLAFGNFDYSLEGIREAGSDGPATKLTPGAPPMASPIASHQCRGSRACSLNMTTPPATRIKTARCAAHSTPCTRPRTTVSASAISSAGRTSKRFVPASPSSRTIAGP